MESVPVPGRFDLRPELLSIQKPVRDHGRIQPEADRRIQRPGRSDPKRALDRIQNHEGRSNRPAGADVHKEKSPARQKGKRLIQPDQAKQLCRVIQRRQNHGHNRTDKAPETAAAGRRFPGHGRQRQAGARQHSEAGCAPGYHRGLRTRRRKEAGDLRKVYPGSNRHHENDR